MNDEIKEILECMEEIANCTFTTDTFELNFEDTKILLDYINNLQQLCDKYEEEHSNEFQCWKRDKKELLDKRGKIQKAIEYINKNKKVVSKYEAKDTRLPIDTFMWGVDKLLNILQGESDK